MSGDSVRVVVDTTLCIGSGQCEMLQPEVFEVGEDEPIAAVIGDGTLPRGQADVVVERCPTGAIRIADTTGQ